MSTFLFFFALSIVFYTYIGYGILLYLLVKIKEKLHPEQPLTLPEPLPDVTLLIAAYNEEKIVNKYVIGHIPKGNGPLFPRTQRKDGRPKPGDAIY